MDEKTASALAKRLAAYSATAGVALAFPAANAQTAPAGNDPDRVITDLQIVYHDFEPDITDCSDYYIDFDFDDDGQADLSLFQANAPYHCFSKVERSHTFYLGLWRADGAPPQNGAEHSRLSSGDVIGPDATFRSNVELAFAYCPGPPEGPFAGEEGYAGFRFIAGDGQLHYGWLRLAVSECPMYPTIYEYAFEATPDTPIAAGAASAALLDGAVNQTVFPASGGTLAYTFSVHNTTDAPLPLDLWIEADGAASFAKRLGSGTLPPGATVARTVRVQVPAVAPAGTYDVRFKLGRFAGRRFVTFERFEITKEVTASTAVSGEGDEAFAVTPVEGDLFAATEAAATLTGTHALSAPVPNPATGPAALTLEVASSQTVRVEVLDALGRRVALLHDGPVAAGAEQRLTFDGSALPAGVYVVRAVGTTFTDARVVSLTR